MDAFNQGASASSVVDVHIREEERDSVIDPSTGLSNKSEVKVEVHDPVKQGDNVTGFISYKVTTVTSRPEYKSRDEPQTVVRRYSSFAALQQRLHQKYPGLILPALPDKDPLRSKARYGGPTPEFISERTKALAVYINRLVNMEKLMGCEEIRQFLEATEDEWKMIMATWNVAQRTAAGTGTKVMQWLKDAIHSGSNLIQQKSDDQEESKDYLALKEYIQNLEKLLSDLQWRGETLVGRISQLAQTFQEFAESTNSLGKFEQGPLGSSFTAFSDHCQQLSERALEAVKQLQDKFTSPLKEAVRMVRSVKNTMADRSTMLSHLQQARTTLEAKKQHLAKLRGQQAQKAENIAKAEREQADAEANLQQCQDSYDQLVNRMTDEMLRYQKERMAEMGLTLREFALIEAQLSADASRIWGSLIRQLQPLAAEAEQAARNAQATSGGAAPPPDTPSGSAVAAM